MKTKKKKTNILNNKNIINNKKEISLINNNSDSINNLVNTILNKNKISSNPTQLDIYYKKMLKLNENELNKLSYEEALILDKRNYLQYYNSLNNTKHPILFTFCANDYNFRYIKIYLFFYNFAVYFTANTLFFTDSTMHKIYENQSSYDFIDNIPQIVYSCIISIILNTCLKILVITDSIISEFKKKKEISNLRGESNEIQKCLKIRIILFYIFTLSLLLIFWYYTSCFRAVYKNTQFHLIKDTVISYASSLLTPFAVNFFPGLFRIPSLRKKNRKCIYNISKFLQLL